MGKLAKSSFAVGATTLMSRLLGLVRDILIAAALGSSSNADAFFVAFKIPNLLRRFVAEGSLSSAFVPVFTEHVKAGTAEANKSLREALGFVLLLTTPLVILGMVFSTQIVSIFAPGFDSETLALSSELTRITFAFVMLISLTALCSSALNSLDRFVIPACPPILLNISLIWGAWFAVDQVEERLAWAIVIGGALGLAPQLALLTKMGFTCLPSFRQRTNTVRNLLTLMLPAVFSASLYQLAVFLNTILASVLEKGSVSWLYYADRLFQFPLGVFTIAVATAALPKLSSLAAEKNIRELQLQSGQIIKWVMFVTIPASLGLIAISDQLVSLIYFRGEFSSYDVDQTSSALNAFAVALAAISVQAILVRIFIATKDAKTPAYVTAFSLTVNLALGLALMGAPESNVSWVSSVQSTLHIFDLNHVGLALASSVASTVGTVLLFILAVKRKLTPKLSYFIKDTLKILLSSAIMFLALKSLAVGAISAVFLGGGIYAVLAYGLNPLNLRQILTRKQ